MDAASSASSASSARRRRPWCPGRRRPADSGGPGGSAPYFISEFPEAYTVAERRNGCCSRSSIDDGQATALLPFTFRFFDQFYSSVEVGTNGYVTFDFDGSNLGNHADPRGELLAEQSDRRSTGTI